MKEILLSAFFVPAHTNLGFTQIKIDTFLAPVSTDSEFSSTYFYPIDRGFRYSSSQEVANLDD